MSAGLIVRLCIEMTLVHALTQEGILLSVSLIIITGVICARAINGLDVSVVGEVKKFS